MKILFFDTTLPYLLKEADYPVGGWAVQLNGWINGLSELGEKIGVLSWRGSEKYVGSVDECIFIDTYNSDDGVRFLRYFTHYYPALKRGILSFSPDVIIQGCAGIPTGLLAKLAKKLNIPFVYRVTANSDSDEKRSDFLSKSELFAFKYGLKHSSLILCQNNYQFENLKNEFPKKDIRIIHNPFSPAILTIDIKTRIDRKYIAWVGVFRREKNLKLLLEIAKKNKDITFKIAGKESEATDDITREIICKLRNMDNVVFVGYLNRKEVLRFLSNAVALLSTSLFEGFPNVFLEAFYTGTPVVAPRRLDPNLMVTENDLGFTDENDAKLACCIAEITNMDKEKYRIMSEKCRRYLDDNFVATVKAAELKNILKTVIT